MQSRLPPHLADRFKALLLILFAIFSFGQFASGRLHYFLAPRMSWLVWLATVLAILIASSYNLIRLAGGASDAAVDREPRPTLSLWTLLLLALPIILGLVVPAAPLDARTIREDDIQFSAPSAADEIDALLAIAPADRGLLDWARIYGLSGEADSLEGQPADITGFVYRDSRLAPDQAIVARYTMRCCYPGARAIGLIVQSEDADMLIQNTWVDAQGSFTVGDFAGESAPVIRADEITIVEPPEQPYIFP